MKKKILIIFLLPCSILLGCLLVNIRQTQVTIGKISTPIKRPPQLVLSESSISIPSPTTLPFLSGDNRKAILTDFVKENGRCQLPCIYGLTPGVSDRQAMNSFVKYFQTNFHEANNQIDDISIDAITNWNWAGASMQFFENKTNVSTSLVAYIQNDKVERIKFFAQAMQLIDIGAKKLYGDPYYDELLKSFSLPSILESYGEPDQIIIRPFPDDLGHPSPPAQYTFSFVLFYPKHGFIVEYIAVRAENGDKFIGCPTKSYVTNILSWNSNESISIDEPIEYFSNLDGISKVNFSEYNQIQDTTSLSTTHFYNLFRIPSSSECVQTPKNLWPRVTQ